MIWNAVDTAPYPAGAVSAAFPASPTVTQSIVMAWVEPASATTRAATPKVELRRGRRANDIGITSELLGGIHNHRNAGVVVPQEPSATTKIGNGTNRAWVGTNRAWAGTNPPKPGTNRRRELL